ncbi:polyprenyl synthetase family protein [Brachybacterium alimentarium]|uniref:polyprenyl synthetase family protein n=1 Tax=Brachybacterium alimentarium TaxID=47845 RepID=UPI000DF45B62|nr:polyprenyl synthetase family protein [Brachybacterium alimentarium]RCS71521.1 polyprenyl synthetase family protein [Brachybacterium alimentarium]
MSTPDHRAVDREIARLLTGAVSAHGTAPSTGRRDLWSAFAQATDDGKRFRPALLTATHRALGGLRGEAAVQVAAALELLHTAFVVQDDVIDGDLMRRGVPSLPGRFAQDVQQHGTSAAEARRYGDAAGILAGDLGLLTAFRAIARCDAPAPVVERLLDLFETTVHSSAIGELADVRLQLGPTEQPGALREALAVAEFKTAVYSFQFPLHAGALLADADSEMLGVLDEIGGLLGIGFQLVDDLLGMFGDERLTGKSALGDLREGKRTALIAHATTTAQWPQLRPLLGEPDLDAADARRARALLTDSGSRAWTEELARWHLTSAVSSASQHGLPSPLVHALSTVTDEILRTSDLLLPPESTATTDTDAGVTAEATEKATEKASAASRSTADPTSNPASRSKPDPNPSPNPNPNPNHDSMAAPSAERTDARTPATTGRPS